MTAMMGELPGYAEKIDSGRYGVNVVSNLGMQAASLVNILTATRDPIEELRRADLVVIGAPMYNFGIPATLKA